MSSSLSTRVLVSISLFAALIAAFALVPPIPVPIIPVPVTLQTLGVMLAGLILGPRAGVLAVILYVVLAILGMPILPGGRGGLAVLAGPTGGFLVGFILSTWVIGMVAKGAGSNASHQGILVFGRYFMACVMGGILALYAVGIPWLAVVTGMKLTQAAIAVLVFIPGDLIKSALASYVAWRLSNLDLLQSRS